MTRTHARRWPVVLFRVLSLVVFVAGLGLAAYAGVQWLQTAQWRPLTVGAVLAHWPTTRTWIVHPTSWQGLHQIVVWTVRVPVYLIGLVVGAAMLFISAG